MAELVFNVDTTAIDTLKNTEIKANFAELAIALKELASNYETVLYTDDEIPEAKKELAKLRSLQKHISDYRIFVKKQVSSPIDRFNDECKRVTSILDGAVSNLDRQIKQSEEKRKQEKLFMIEQYFENAIINMKNPEFITLDYVLNEKWANKGYTLEQAYKDINAGIQTVDSEVFVIKSLNSEFELSLLDCYRSTHSIPEVMQLHERLTEQKRQQEQFKLQQEQLRLQREQELKAMAEAQKASEPLPFSEDTVDEIPAPEMAQPTKTDSSEQMFVATYQVIGTKRELESLSGLFNNLRVKYRTINVAKVGE